MRFRRKLATISYLTPVGWVFSFLQYSNKEHSSLISFHLKQSLGLNLFLLFICATDIFFFNYIHPLAMICIYSFFLILFISGIENATKGKQKALPVFGNSLTILFTFIK